MMHLKIRKGEDNEGGEEVNKMEYHCIYCDVQKSVNDFDGCISATKYLEQESEKNYDQLFNDFLMDDPTLPIVDSIPCPNTKCPANIKVKSKAKENQIIYVRYDHDNMKFCYICKNCKTRWITPEYQKIQIISEGKKC